MATISTNGTLSRPLWSDRELADLNWHDSHIRAMLLGDEGRQLLFDLDLICEWRRPPEKDGVFSFYVAPATLVFPYAHEIAASLATGAPMSIFGITKENPRPTPHGNAAVWTWTIDGPHGQISGRSTGFVLYVRREPLLTQSQLLTLQERGGISFDIPGG